MRTVFALVLLMACSGGTDDTGTTSLTAPEVGTTPADSASSSADITGEVTTPSEGAADITYAFSWQTDAGLTWEQETLPSTATTKGETWTLSVTPSAGSVSGPPGSATVDIVNAPPSLTSAEFSPSSPTIGSPLTCVPVGGEDLDGDTLSYTYEWTVNGTVVSETSDTLDASEITAGASISCSITPFDGEESGNTVSVTGEALNSPPTAAGSAITPTAPTAADDLLCSGTGGTDPDGDTVTFINYEWSVNGTASSETSATLSAGVIVGGDSVVCTAIPFDGVANGAGVASTAVTVLNTAPVVTQAQIGPSNALAEDTIVCTGAATDLDNDSVTWTYSWAIGGTTQAETSSFLSPGNFVYNDVITCTATASDGTDTASLTSSPLTIGNTPPTIAGVTITPATATADLDLTCGYTTTADIDNQTVNVTYAWTVAGSNFSGAVLPAGSGGKGDTAVCTATPNDGVANGSQRMANLVFANTPPPQPTVAVGPSNATVASPLTCSATPLTDADGDSITYSYEWFLSGASVGVGTPLAAQIAVGGDIVTCEAIGTDGTDDSPVGTGTLTIDNTLPGAPTVVISPSTAMAADVLSCSASPATDADGETVTYTYAWSVNNTPMGTNTSLPANSAYRGDTVECEAVGTDGTGAGAVGSDSMVMGNTPPTVASADLTANIFESALVRCTAGTTDDVDGDAVTVTYRWEVAGVTVNENTPTLDDGWFSRGDTIQCFVTPHDSYDAGIEVASQLQTVLNTTPTVPASVSINPARPVPGVDDMVCAGSGSTDPDDNDTVTYVYAWTRNGVDYTGTTTNTTNDTVRGSATTPGDTFVCRVTATDGTATSGSRSASVTLLSIFPLTEVCGSPTVNGQVCSGNCTTNTPQYTEAFCMLEGFGFADSYTEHTSGNYEGYYYNEAADGLLDECSDLTYFTNYGATTNCTCASQLECGVSTINEFGAVNGSTQTLGGRMRGMAVQATSAKTIYNYSTYLNLPSTCDLDWYVFEASSMAGTWTQVWSSQTRAGGGSFHLAGPLRLQTVPGRYYAFTWATAPACVATGYVQSGVTDPLDFGTLAGYVFDNAYPGFSTIYTPPNTTSTTTTYGPVQFSVGQ